MLDYSNRLLTLSQSLEDKAMQVEAYILSALASIEKDEDLHIILSFLDQGLTINTTLNDTTRFIRLYDTMGKAYIKVGFHDKAFFIIKKDFCWLKRFKTSPE